MNRLPLGSCDRSCKLWEHVVVTWRSTLRGANEERCVTALCGIHQAELQCKSHGGEILSRKRNETLRLLHFSMCTTDRNSSTVSKGLRQYTYFFVRLYEATHWDRHKRASLFSYISLQNTPVCLASGSCPSEHPYYHTHLHLFTVSTVHHIYRSQTTSPSIFPLQFCKGRLRCKGWFMTVSQSVRLLFPWDAHDASCAFSILLTYRTNEVFP